MFKIKLFEEILGKIQKVLEKLSEMDKDQMDSTFRMIEKISENDAKKLEEMKKINRALWAIAFLLFILIIICS